MQSLYAGPGRTDERTLGLIDQRRVDGAPNGGLPHRGERRRIAVIGAGIAGLSCAWALGAQHDVTLYESAPRLGGHSNTVAPAGLGGLAIDTGFIVYNEPAYPNLSALFAHLGVETAASDMSFAVSLDGGRLEYAGTDLRGLFAQRRNLLRPRFWRMLAQLLRFYRLAPAVLESIDETMTLGAWLAANGPFDAMREDHLLPMAAAIWSCPSGSVDDYPAAAFLRFCRNHGLLQVSGRPAWRTVVGGSQRYVERLRAAFTGTVRLGNAVRAVRPDGRDVAVTDAGGATTYYDDVVLACHAPDALALLPDAPAALSRTLAAFRTTRNHAVLHSDATLMPSRRAAWSSWNVIGPAGNDAADGDDPPCVSYWMNRLQGLPADAPPLFVTLNPPRTPDRVWHSENYAHPVFDGAALAAQRRLWGMQGDDGLWFAGAWLGAGFHEDGLQSGLAVAEAAGGVARPWSVADPSGRMPGPLLAPRTVTRWAA